MTGFDGVFLAAVVAFAVFVLTLWLEREKKNGKKLVIAIVSSIMVLAMLVFIAKTAGFESTLFGIEKSDSTSSQPTETVTEELDALDEQDVISDVEDDGKDSTGIVTEQNENLAKDVVSEDKTEENRPVELSKLKMTESRHIELTEKTAEDTVGNKYPSGNVFVIHAEGTEEYGKALFYTGNKYRYLSGVIAVSDESTQSDEVQLEGYVEILTKNTDGEAKQIYESPILSRAFSQIELNDLDIENPEWIEIRFYSSGDYYSLAEGYHSLSIILSDFEVYD